MFNEGHIYFFKGFIFNNGGQPEDKYFIVLRITDKDLVIGTLPTRTNKVPAFVNIDHGCVNIEERMYNCYHFKKNKPICDKGFAFDMPTFIYGGDIAYYSRERMEKNYQLEVNFKLIDKLTDEEFKSVIECFTKSNSVNRGIKKELGR